MRGTGGVGDDPPLVLLPGMGCTAALWSQLTLPAGVAVHCPELDQDDLDRQVDQLLDELPARFALAGHSLGAIVAMAVVRRAPERVTRLALLSTNPRAPTDAQRRTWRRLQEQLESSSPREVQASLLPTLLSPAVLGRRADLVERTLAMADDLGATTFDRQLRLQATRVDERPGLRAVRCPTLILAARDDRLCSVAKHEEIAELVGPSRLTLLADCAHLSTLEQPVPVSTELARWLQPCRATPGAVPVASGLPPG